MKVRTPMELFGAITGVGLIPAIAVGSVIGVATKDYKPIPQPTSSAEVNEDFGSKTDSESPRGRVESLKPSKPASNRVTPTRTYSYKTPHAQGSTSASPTKKASKSPSPTKTGSPEPTKTFTKPVESTPSSPSGTVPITPRPEATEDLPAPKNS